MVVNLPYIIYIQPFRETRYPDGFKLWIQIKFQIFSQTRRWKYFFFLASLSGCPCVVLWEVIHGSTEFSNASYVICFPGSLLDLIIVKQDIYIDQLIMLQ